MARRNLRFCSLLVTSLVTGVALAGCGQKAEREEAPPANETSDRSPEVTETLPAVPASATIPPPPTRPVEVYSFDLPKEYPLAAASWKANLPLDFQDLAWAAKFEGVGSPLRTVTLNRKQVLFGSLCEPHNCGNNRVGFVLTPDQRRVVGFVQITDDQTGAVSMTPVGAPTREEQACLVKLDDDLEATTC